MTVTLNLATRDRVRINGIEYVVGELPWRSAEHRAVLELIVPGGRYDPSPVWPADEGDSVGGPPLIDGGERPVIDRFAGEHEFLSNFAFTPVRYAGRTWPTVEHAFQAAKTLDLDDLLAIGRAPTPAAAKRLGRKVTLRPGWDEMRFNVMATLVARKFGPGSMYSTALLDTGEALLIEGNTWGDTEWGAVRDSSVEGRPWRGWNRLGRILMDVRRQLQAEWGAGSA
jgi:ribA/ribD-fused uncharacterized protein